MGVERVFVDTNILLSGLMFVGNESQLLELAAQGKIRLLISAAVLDEARAVLEARFPAYVDVLAKFLALLDYDEVPYPSDDAANEASAVVRDPADAVILASILLAKPDSAITGDKDLLTDRVRGVAPMCRCAEYLRKRGLE